MNVVKCLSKILFTLMTFAFNSEPILACATTATYRSVIVNDAPERIPAEAVTFKVRIDAAFFSLEKAEIQGLAGALVEDRGDYVTGTKFEIKVRLLTMCETWVEIWSDSHSIDANGNLTGYVTGIVTVPENDGKLFIQPLLFQRAKDRNWSKVPSWSAGRAPAAGPPARMKVDPDGSWKVLKVTAGDLANDLSETIRESTEALEEE